MPPLQQCGKMRNTITMCRRLQNEETCVGNNGSEYHCVKEKGKGGLLHPLLAHGFVLKSSMERQVKGGKQFKDPLWSLCRQEETGGKHTFPLGTGQLSFFSCLAAFFSLESLHLIFELRLDIFHKMCLSSCRDEGLIKA